MRHRPAPRPPRSGASARAAVVLAAAAAGLAAAAPAHGAEAPVAEEVELRGTVDGTVLATRRDADPAPLLAGRDGGAPVPLPGVAPVDPRAPVHAGTDADGRPIAILPRCGGEEGAGSGGRCRLRQVDLTTGRETTVPGIDAPGQPEIEGAMDRGRVAFLRAYRGRAGSQVLYWRDTTGSRGSERVTSTVGDDLAVRGRWIAQVRSIDAPTACGSRDLLELRSPGGRLRRVAGRTCGEEGGFVVDPIFLDGDLHHGIATTSGGQARRYDLGTGRTTRRDAAGGFGSIAPLSRDAALVTRATGPDALGASCDDQQDDGVTCSLLRVDGLGL